MSAGSGSGRSAAIAWFVSLNVVAVIFAGTFLVAPVFLHFVERSEEIAENTVQLAHFEKAIQQAQAAAKGAAGRDDVFLPGHEERVVSADLQAALKSISASAGVKLLGLRGLPGGRVQQIRAVAVGVDLEGSLAAIRDMMRTVESQIPLLFVASVSLRSVAEGDDGVIRAELMVMGGIRELSKPDDQEVVSR